MKKSLFFALIFLGSFGLATAQSPGSLSGQKAESTSSFTQTELLGYKDITPVLSALNKGKDYSQFILLRFNLIVSFTEGAVSTTITEPGDGGSLNEKQRGLITKYAGKGASFTFDAITLMEPGKPGTPYDPSKENIFSVANVSFSVTK